MSDYKRTKAVRYKIPEEITKKFREKYNKKYLDPDWFIEYYNKQAKEEILIDSYKITKQNEMTIGSGLIYNDKDSNYEYYIDLILDSNYSENSGDFEFVRLLTQKEFDKYKNNFMKLIPNIKLENLRYVDYCYYNGVDEPAIWELEDI